MTLGVTFLQMFFRAVESHWPATYLALSSGVDYAISRHLIRYLAFRLLPVVTVCVFVAVTLTRSGLPSVLPVLVVGLVHAALTSGRAFVATLRSPLRRQRPLLLVVHLAVSFAVVGAAIGGLLVSPFFEGYIPPLEQVSSDLWTGLIAGIVGAYAVRVTGTRHVASAKAFADSRASIPGALWSAVPNLAEEAEADPVLVRAVMLVENIQRPSWIRRLERLAASRFQKPATLGILQVRADPTETDDEILFRAINERFRGWNVWDGESVDYEQVERFARTYNRDSNFLEMLYEALGYSQMHPN